MASLIDIDFEKAAKGFSILWQDVIKPFGGAILIGFAMGMYVMAQIADASNAALIQELRTEIARLRNDIEKLERRLEPFDKHGADLLLNRPRAEGSAAWPEPDEVRTGGAPVPNMRPRTFPEAARAAYARS